MPPLTVPAAAPQFGNFYVPRFEIASSGGALAASVLRDVIQVTYNDSTTEIDSFDITVNNWDAERRRFKYVGSERRAQAEEDVFRTFDPCAREFELKLGYGSELVTIVKGTPTSLEPTFPAGSAPTLTVRALNVLFKLRTRQYRTHWTGKKISEIAEDIGRRQTGGARRFPIDIHVSRTAKQSEPQLDYVAQENQYDIDFLLLEARKIGYAVYVDRDTSGSEFLYFGPSNERQSGVPDITYELKWGISLVDFTPKLSTAHQVKSVEVRSWNRQTNRSIRKKADLNSQGLVNEDLVYLLQQPGCEPREEVVTNEPMHTPEEAERRALAILSERLKQLVEATGTTVGLPNLRAGQRIRIRGVGARFSGTYFVIKTTHTLNDSGYITKFTARREQGQGAAS
jgi:phage protein D